MAIFYALDVHGYAEIEELKSFDWTNVLKSVKIIFQKARKSVMVVDVSANTGTARIETKCNDLFFWKSLCLNCAGLKIK